MKVLQTQLLQTQLNAKKSHIYVNKTTLTNGSVVVSHIYGSFLNKL